MSSDALAQVTPLLITYNEEANIARTLASLHWAQRIVIVDSGSTDRTLEILSSTPNVHVVHRVFDTHAQQWNFGLSLIHSGWVLSMDADYIVTTSLRKEILLGLQKARQSSVTGFLIPFRYCVSGKPLRGSVLPPRLALFEARSAVYIDDGHTQLLHFSGKYERLRQPFLHDDRKSLCRWLWAQNRYLDLEADKLLTMPECELSFADRVRKRYVFAPFAVLILCLIWHRGLFDGWRGWFYAFQRLYVEVLLSLMLWERRRMPSAPCSHQATDCVDVAKPLSSR
jgi:glycosyltransferase involved in cell wall biosynthesis